jgi:uncharacterized protein GlcG (DUF336 family)
MPKLGLREANVIIANALEKGRAVQVPPLAVVVIDASGHMIAAQREDGASMFRIDIALGKAWGAVAMGCSSRALAKRAQSNPNFINALVATADGKLLPQQGGVLIRAADGEILGAVGISGASGDEDEAFGAHGVEQAGLKPDAAA